MRALYNLLIIGFTITITECLYEDQVGLFEWRQQYVGKPKFLHLDIASSIKRVIVGTENNVVAALSLKGGDVIWRQVLEQGKEGVIQAFAVNKNLVTVSGTRTPLVRGWDLENGHLLSEWAPSGLLPGRSTFWLIYEDSVIAMQLSHFEVTVRKYALKTGAVVSTQTFEASSSLESSSCVAQGGYLSCLDIEGLFTVVDATREPAEISSRAAGSDLDNAQELRTIGGQFPAIVAVSNRSQTIVALSIPMVIPIDVPQDAVVSTVSGDEDTYIVVTQLLKEKLEIQIYSIDGDEYPELENTLAWSPTTGLPELVSGTCQVRRDRSVACRLAVVAADHSLLMIQHPGPLLWTREEALASVLSVELLDLPVSETDAAIETEFGNKNDGFVGLFYRRIASQLSQLQSLLATVLGIQGGSTGQAKGLVRDEFGLHKLIVAVTESGKVFGIDNLSGEIVWSVLADLEPLRQQSNPTYAMFVLRSAIHPPHLAKLAILGRSNNHHVVLTLDPISGEAEPLRILPFTVRQVMALQHTDKTLLKCLLLLSDSGEVHVHPEAAKKTAAKAAHNTYMYTVDRSTGVAVGYKLIADGDNIVARQSWLARLGPDDAHVVAVASKRDIERVHSQGRVLGDRSVLYKYVNPNLVAIFTQGYHPSHKNILNVYLIDVVSGLIVFSTTHRRAREPVHVVHSENWLVYTWMSEKHRRTEMAALELYEGTSQSNETAFSSLTAPPLLPMVERQAYILPANVLAIKDTLTEKGITNKNIIIALASGGILELPWAYLDPRRTMLVTPEMREEGIVPYIPELPIPYEAIVNYNQSVAQIRGIHSAPSGIESTSLIFVYGLDIFYTRVAPSKTFDLLKEDFDYFFINAVLAGLILASIITRRLSSRNALKQAWK